MHSLNRANLLLPKAISAPSYDLTRVLPGIVHVGLGGFHRAHFARYTHDLMTIDPGALGWGIVGSGLRASDKALLEILRLQDGLYTLIETDGAAEERTLIASLINTIDASAQSEELLAAIARPATRIVSVTVSEHGYHLDGATKSLNTNDPAIQHDLAMPHTPRSLPGILVEGYRRRRAAGGRPFTAMSCDNIQHNGRVLRATVIALAELSDPSLAAWIGMYGAFPNSMVDRITPVPTHAQIAGFALETGLPDGAALFCESFRQWIIEDTFADGRPDWDRVGAQFVDDVAPYEAMKLRLLNASHLAIAGLGALIGYESIAATISDTLICRFMVRLMDTETGPTLPPVPGVDLNAYKATLIDRFANPAIRDTVERVNADAPLNLLLDPLKDRLSIGAPIRLLSLGVAAWCLRVKREAELQVQGRPMGKAEAILQQRARSPGGPISFLSVDEIFGQLGREPELVDAVRYWLRSFDQIGVAETLREAAANRLI
jgi:mannitol 2-dehydrogenase